MPTMDNVVADLLTQLAEDIRSGKVELKHSTKKMDVERAYVNGVWDFFRTQDTLLTLVYFNKEMRQAELKKREEYMVENPTATFELRT